MGSRGVVRIQNEFFDSHEAADFRHMKSSDPANDASPWQRRSVEFSSPLSVKRTRNSTGCGSAGLFVVAMSQMSRVVEPGDGVRYPMIAMLSTWYPVPWST